MDRCCFCGSEQVRSAFHDAYHKVDKSFGPFTLFTCRQCGSLGTANAPSVARLAEFYQHYDQSRPEWYRSASASGALSPQYSFYARLVSDAMQVTSSWLDVGCGHGEVANAVVQSHPNGMAIDIQERPESLASEVCYAPVDLNRSGWAGGLEDRFDHVFSIAVWEHVLSPSDFAKQCLSLVAPGGTLSLITPDYCSAARRILRRFWPYFQPGEHISIPSSLGAKVCITTAADELGINISAAKVEPLRVRYSIRYLFDVMRLSRISSVVPPSLATPVPTGILLATVKRS